MEDTGSPASNRHLKWIIDHTNGRVHAWGSDEKHPQGTHRQEAEKILGRPVRAQDGDILGMAVVEKGQVKVQAYYGAVVPQKVLDHMKNAYGGHEVRTAAIEPPLVRVPHWLEDEGQLIRVDHHEAAAEWAQENLNV